MPRHIKSRSQGFLRHSVSFQFRHLYLKIFVFCSLNYYKNNFVADRDVINCVTELVHVGRERKPEFRFTFPAHAFSFSNALFRIATHILVRHCYRIRRISTVFAYIQRGNIRGTFQYIKRANGKSNASVSHLHLSCLVQLLESA